MLKFAAPLVTLFSFLLISGCGDSGPQVVEVSGRATYKQKPVPRLVLTFSPANGRASIGTTDGNGNFELVYEGERKGAIQGTHTVTIDYMPGDPGEEMDILEGKKKRPPVVEAILRKYVMGNNRLTVEVKEATTTFDLKLD